MAYVNFWKGPAADYVAETHGEGIYQCTDTGDTYIFGVLNSGSGGGKMLYQETTFEELVQKRNNNELIPGCYYSITDYQCCYIEPVTNSERVEQAANWNIVVVAISNFELSEEAIITDKSGKNLGYKKCLFTVDKTRLSWTSSCTDGNFRGAIYRLINKNDVDCPYDFNHLKFARYAITDITMNDTKGSSTYVSPWRALNPRSNTLPASRDERYAVGAGIEEEVEFVKQVFAGTFRQLWENAGLEPATPVLAPLSNDYINEHWKAFNSTTHTRNKYLAYSTTMSLNNSYVGSSGANMVNIAIDSGDVQYLYTFDKNGEDATELEISGIPMVFQVKIDNNECFNFGDYPLVNIVFNIAADFYSSQYPFYDVKISGVSGNCTILLTGDNGYGGKTTFEHVTMDNLRVSLMIATRVSNVHFSHINIGNLFIGTNLDNVKFEDTRRNIITGQMVSTDLIKCSNNLFVNTNYYADYTDGKTTANDGEYTYQTVFKGCYGNIFSPFQYSNLLGNHINSNTFKNPYNKGVTVLGRVGYCFFHTLMWGVTIEYNLIGVYFSKAISETHFCPNSMYLPEVHTNMDFCSATPVNTNRIRNVRFVGYQIPRDQVAKAKNNANGVTQIITNTTSRYLMGVEKDGDGNMFLADDGTYKAPTVDTSHLATKAVDTSHLATKEELEWYSSCKTITSLTNVNLSEAQVLEGDFNSNQSLTCQDNLPDGKECHIVIRNTSSSPITITLPNSSQFINMSADTLEIPNNDGSNNNYGEINILNTGFRCMVRAAASVR